MRPPLTRGTAVRGLFAAGLVGAIAWALLSLAQHLTRGTHRQQGSTPMMHGWEDMGWTMGGIGYRLDSAALAGRPRNRRARQVSDVRPEMRPL